MWVRIPLLPLVKGAIMHIYSIRDVIHEASKGKCPGHLTMAAMDDVEDIESLLLEFLESESLTAEQETRIRMLFIDFNSGENDE